MVSAPVALAISAGLTAATTTASYFSQKAAGEDAQEAQEKANRTSQAEAQVNNARERRKAMAQARMAQARNSANQSAQVQSSSSLIGAQSSVASSLGSNIQAQKSRIGNQAAIQGYRQDAANAIRQGKERTGALNAINSIGQFGVGVNNVYNPAPTA
jgi:Flp pilus assembly protein TadB